MKTPIPLVLVGFSLLLSACSQAPQKQILGKWQRDGETNEFFSDGTFISIQPGKTTKGTWQFSENKILKFTFTREDYPDFPVTVSREYYFNGDKLFYKIKGSDKPYDVIQRIN